MRLECPAAEKLSGSIISIRFRVLHFGIHDSVLACRMVSCMLLAELKVRNPMVFVMMFKVRYILQI